MDTGHNTADTAQYSAQVLTNVYSEGDTLTLHLRNSLLSREHQVMMDIKEGMELISCCCQDPEAEGPEREGRWSLVTAPSFTISPSAVFHRSIV